MCAHEPTLPAHLSIYVFKNAKCDVMNAKGSIFGYGCWSIVREGIKMGTFAFFFVSEDWTLV